MKKPKIKVSIQGEEVFFGPGTATLMNFIEETGSVRDACEEMGMSYSKAWKILNRIERELGEPVLNRARGGASGGHTSLTEFGRTYLATYETYNEKVQKYAQDEMKKAFAKYE